MYRAYCDECCWSAVDTWTDEDNAYADVNQHVQEAHAFMCGVKRVEGSDHVDGE